MKSLLIIGAGPNQVPAIRLAKARGYRVVATDMDPNAEGFALCDETGVASTRDTEATIAFARSVHQGHPFSGVMTMASESAVTVACVAAALGLPGVPPEAAMNATHKVRRQLLFRERGIPSPHFSFASDAAEACARADELGWPVVVKPADSAGSRGVQKINTPEEMTGAVDEIRAHSKQPEFLIEEFLSGTEHSIEGVVIDGQVHWAGFSDRNYDKKEIYPPYFLEDGDTLPTTISAARFDEVKAIATRAVHALGLTWGPVKGDILIDRQKGVRMLEMAARLSGDYFCYETIPLHNGVNLLEVVMDLALGLPVDPARMRPRFDHGVALRYVWPAPGEVIAIEGLEEARRMPGVHFVRFEPHWRNIGPGSVIQPARSMGERVACVMAAGADRDEAIARAEAAVSTIQIRTNPVPAPV